MSEAGRPAVGEPGGLGEERSEADRTGRGTSPGELGIELLSAGEAAGGGRLARFAVAAGSPLFTGHFPGRPLLPGVAQLALIGWTLAARRDGAGAAHGPAVCLEVEHLRLRALVHADDVLEVRVLRVPGNPGEEDQGNVRFELSRAGEVVTRGGGRWLPAEEAGGEPEGEAGATRSGGAGGEPKRGAGETRAGEPGGEPEGAAGAARTGGAGAMPAAGAAAVVEAGAGGAGMEVRLPHGAPALMVRRVIATGAGEICCACEIAAEHPLTRAGRAPGYLAIEAAAQAAGVLAAAAGGPRPAARLGYLVGARQARLPAALPAGRPFRASVWLEASAPPLGIYRFAVDGGDGGGSGQGAGREGAAGTLSIYLGD